MNFVKNNIRFRSVAAKALEYFYNSKAFMLNDLILERNQFSEVARETLLLLFNGYSRFVNELESMMLNRYIMDSSDINQIVGHLESIHQTNCNVFDGHYNLFDPQFIRAWQKTHSQNQNALILRVKGILNLTQMEAYPSIVNSIVYALQATLYELYELDCLLGSNFVTKRCTCNRSNTNKLVAYVDDYALDYYSATGTFLLHERIQQYLGMVCEPFPLTIKNYSSETVSMLNGKIEGDDPLATLLKQLQEYVTILEIVCVPPILHKR